MLLVYLSSRIDLNSVKSYLKVKGLDDHMLLFDVTDLVEELIAEPSEVVIFDYKGDYELVERLRTIGDLVMGLKVFVSNSSIGQMYTNLTEDIFVLPNALNLMIYIWESPVFSLGNILNAEDLGREVFSVDDFATIDTETEVIEFKTTIEDMGDMDLASIKLLKLAKYQLAESYKEEINAELVAEEEEELSDEILYDLPSRTLDGLLRRNGFSTGESNDEFNLDDAVSSANEVDNEFSVNDARADIEGEGNKILHLLKNTVFVEKQQKEFSVPSISFTGDDCRSENWITLEEQQAEEEPTLTEEQQAEEEIISADTEESLPEDDGTEEPELEDAGTEEPELEDDGAEEPELEDDDTEEPTSTDDTEESELEDEGSEESELEDKDMEEPTSIDTVEEPVPAESESTDTVEELAPTEPKFEESVSEVNNDTEEPVPESIDSEESVPADENQPVPAEEQGSVISMKNSDDVEKQQVIIEEVDNTLAPSEEHIEENIIYKEYDESDADSYDEVVEYKKSITSDTEVKAEYDGDIRDDMKSNDTLTGVVNESTGVLSKGSYTVNQADFEAIKESQKGIIDKLRQSKKSSQPVQEATKPAPRVLEGVKSYVAPTKKVDKVVAIKTVEAEAESVSKPKTGGLSGLRRRSVKTFKSAYEYFQHTLPLTPERTKVLDEINEYVITENYKGSSLLLENELYSRGFITDDEMIAFMKNYLHQNVMTLEELMRCDVIVDELWSVEESLANGLLQISNKYTNSEGNAICIVCCTKAFPLLKSLSVQYERIVQFITLEKFIKIRLGGEE